MAEYLIQDTTLIAIADAIRTVSGKSDLIPVSTMAEEILSLGNAASELYLFNAGDACESVTGGWEGTGSIVDDYINLQRWSDTYATGRTVTTVLSIDLTNYRSLVVTVNSYNHTGTIAIRTSATGSNVRSVSVTKNGTFTLDISDISGYHFIYLASTGKQTNNGSIGFHVTEVKLIK